MILSIVLLALGFILLIKGADVFIDGASSTAANLRIPKIIIGISVVAFGTSAPELAISIKAMANNNADIVFGNLIGSNVINVSLILGIAALIKPIIIKSHTLKNDLPFCLLISTVLIILLLDNNISNISSNSITRSDAFIILCFFGVFIYYLIKLVSDGDIKERSKPKYKLHQSLVLLGIGLAAIIIGSDFVVNNASNIAKLMGISDRIISLTIIAIGTSLPELITVITSSIKGEQDLLLGNIIGSNIFNICVVLGIPVAIFGNLMSVNFKLIDIIALFGSSLFLLIFAWTHKKISRFEGMLLLILFLIYYILVFLS